MSNEDAWQQAYEQALHSCGWQQAYEQALHSCGVLRLRINDVGEQALALRRQRDAAIVERDRLRRELEALRTHVDERARQHERMFRYEAESALHDVSDRLDAILRGES